MKDHPRRRDTSRKRRGDTVATFLKSRRYMYNDCIWTLKLWICLFKQKCCYIDSYWSFLFMYIAGNCFLLDKCGPWASGFCLFVLFVCLGFFCDFLPERGLLTGIDVRKTDHVQIYFYKWRFCHLNTLILYINCTYKHNYIKTGKWHL